MIEINLLPEKLRTKTRFKKIEVGIKAKYFRYIMPSVLGILICTHIYLLVINISRSGELGLLNKKWQELEPQRKMLDDFNKEYALFTKDAQEIQQLTTKQINWAEKLNKLSLSLPVGVWFSELSVSSRDFTLQGSVVSLQKEEMNLIKKLIDSLKNDASFFKDFESLELSSVQKKIIGGYDIADFVLSGSLKSN